MHRKQAEAKLKALGYEIDWSVTGPNGDWFGTNRAWSGTFDAIGRYCIDGDCRGEVVFGDNAADFYKNAIEAAKGYSKPEPCRYAPGTCPFHDDA